MEIEAKFIIPDKETCERLQETDQLAGFLLSSGHSRSIHDFYLDTAELSIKQAGYACRKREQTDKTVITLKQLAASDQAVHRREEFEISLPAADLPPAQWPDSPARNLILQFIQQKPLIPLFDFKVDLLVGLKVLLLQNLWIVSHCLGPPEFLGSWPRSRNGRTACPEPC